MASLQASISIIRCPEFYLCQNIYCPLPLLSSSSLLTYNNYRTCSINSLLTPNISHPSIATAAFQLTNFNSHLTMAPPMLPPLVLPNRAYETTLSTRSLRSMLKRLETVPITPPAQSIVVGPAQQCCEEKTVRFAEDVQVHFVEPIKESLIVHDGDSIPSCSPLGYIWESCRDLISAWEPCLLADKEFEEQTHLDSMYNVWG